MFAKKQFLKLLALPLFAAPFYAFAGPSYTATIMPENFYATGITANGQVFGTWRPDGDLRAAVWSAGTISAIGESGTALRKVSSTGVALGAMFSDGGGMRTIVYKDGAMHFIDAVDPYNARLNGINSSGDFVGDVIVHRGTDYAFRYAGGRMEPLGNFGGKGSSAYGINDAGVIVGTAEDAGGTYHAYAYRDNEMIDIGTLGGDYSSASAINNAGDIVGSSSTVEGKLHTFLYSNGVMSDLGSLGGAAWANGLNNFRQVVGYGYLGDDTTGRTSAFLYSDRKMQDLNDLVTGLDGWRLESAKQINDAGQILVSACTSAGNCRDMLLDPIAAVPEPATWAMLLAGVAGLLGRRKAANRRLA